MSNTRQQFDCYPDKDGGIVIITDGFDDEPALVHNHISLTRAKEIYLALGEAIGVNPLNVLRQVKESDIQRYMANGSFSLPGEVRGEIQKILTIFEQ